MSGSGHPLESHQHDGAHMCCSAKPVGSLQQSLNEMDFERGIWTAALDGDDDRVKKMLSQGTDANAKDSSGYTALHYAARSGHLGVCRTLLGKGADVNMKTRSGGATALHRACLCGHLQVVALLLDSRANAKLQDADGQTALHKAAERGHYSILETVVSKCPESKSIVDNHGRLPFDCYKGQDKTIQSLLT